MADGDRSPISENDGRWQDLLIPKEKKIK